MSCGVGCRRGLDPALLWLWCKPLATAPIRPLAWEPPYAAGAAQEIEKDKKKKKCIGKVPLVAQQVTNPTSIHEVLCLIPGLTKWVKDLALP